MNIFFSCDNHYAKYLLVAISSILKSRDKNHETYPIYFYILSSNIEQNSIEYITHFINPKNAEVHFIPVPDDDFNQFPINIDYLSHAAYSRLKAADYLPQHLDKVIYLDIDILVNGSLLPLWNLELGHFPIAACEDPFVEYSTHKETIGLASSHHYFNSGVLLVNLKRWREIDIFTQALDIVNRTNLKYQDQDILNIIFQHNVLYVDSRFNFTRNHREMIKKKGNKNSAIATMPIAIYHYVGAKKAWHSTCTVSRCALFDKIYREFINPPWCMEKISSIQRLKRFRKDITDKIFYKIY